MNKVQTSPHSYKQLCALSTALVVSVFAYLYFLNISVVHVVIRTEADIQQNQLRAEIAQLETKYMSAQHEVASRIALLDVSEGEFSKVFISRTETDTLVQAN